MSKFFTIVIPTYNPRNLIRPLLDSITKNDCIDDITVLISDDCSSEPFDDILTDYKNLDIQVIKNEQHQGFPRAGRQHGADNVKTPWFCFADQDDRFVDHAFDGIKKFIEENNAEKYIVSDLICDVKETGERIIFENYKGWTHGKFYEKAFWDKYGIQYDKIHYCEDIGLTTKVDCLMIALKAKAFEYQGSVYIWNRRDDSLANEEYFIKSFPEYIQITFGMCIKYMEKYKDNEELFKIYVLKAIMAFLHVYFYLQSPILYNRNEEKHKIALCLQPLYTHFKNLIGHTNTSFIDFVHIELIDIYNQTRNDDFKQVPFIEQISFRDWINSYLD